MYYYGYCLSSLLIFAFFSSRFVFIMGTSIALSVNSLLCAGKTRRSLLGKVVWRSVQLFLIGVFVIGPHYCNGPCEYKHTYYCMCTPASLCSYPLYLHTVDWNNLRIPGVLQRLAWSYLVVACLDIMVAKGHVNVLTTVSPLSFTCV